MISEEYWVVNIVIFESFVDMLVLSLFILYYFDYTNIFHYYAKVVSLDNLRNLFRYLNF